MEKIGFGGGCHWCTEAMYTFLIGVSKVDQGYIRSTDKNNYFSEAIIVHFDSSKISLQTLIHIHLLTHKSTVEHSFRTKYRSAVYYFNEYQAQQASNSIQQLQSEFTDVIITKVLTFSEFKSSREELLNYYQKDNNKPFCTTYIDPKLKMLLSKFSKHIKPLELTHLRSS